MRIFKRAKLQPHESQLHSPMYESNQWNRSAMIITRTVLSPSHAYCLRVGLLLNSACSNLKICFAFDKSARPRGVEWTLRDGPTEPARTFSRPPVSKQRNRIARCKNTHPPHAHLKQPRILGLLQRCLVSERTTTRVSLS